MSKAKTVRSLCMELADWEYCKETLSSGMSNSYVLQLIKTNVMEAIYDLIIERGIYNFKQIYKANTGVIMKDLNELMGHKQ